MEEVKVKKKSGEITEDEIRTIKELVCEHIKEALLAVDQNFERRFK